MKNPESFPDFYLKELPTPPAYQQLAEKMVADPEYLPTLAEANEIDLVTRQQKFHREFNEHELWNKEYIEKLAAYLVERIAVIAEKTGRDELLILEPGAGSGRLTHFLAQAVEIGLKDHPGIKVNFLAVDNQSSTTNIWPVFPVEKIDVQEAYAEYLPDFIIVSWPSQYCDWQNGPASVKGYLVIGPPDLCGGFDQDEEDGWVAIPGFTKHRLTEAEAVQTSKDNYSTTVAYEKATE